MGSQRQLTKQRRVDYSVGHARKRALERYSLNLTQEDIFNIVDLIRAGRSGTVVFMRRQSKRRTVWKVKYKGTWLYLIYNKKEGVIATFLTEQMYNNPMYPKGR